MQLTIQFRNAHVIAKKGCPYSDYVWMCELDEMKGVLKGKSYRNRTQAKIFIHHISETQRDLDRVEMKTVNCISLILDLSVIEDEIVYVHYAKDGKVNVKLLGLENVERADTEGILGVIKSAATNHTG